MGMEIAGEVTEVKTTSREADEWDARYTERDRVWSGEPNGALVDEMTGARPGRALDVGCGEGADALWLARQGWAVTALDISQVALDRAKAHADGEVVDITWVLSGLLDADLPAGGFDLVSAQYPALRGTPTVLPNARWSPPSHRAASCWLCTTTSATRMRRASTASIPMIGSHPVMWRRYSMTAGTSTSTRCGSVRSVAAREHTTPTTWFYGPTGGPTVALPSGIRLPVVLSTPTQDHTVKPRREQLPPLHRPMVAPTPTIAPATGTTDRHGGSTITPTRPETRGHHHRTGRDAHP